MKTKWEQHPEIYQVAGGKKHLARKDGVFYLCGIGRHTVSSWDGGITASSDVPIGRLLTEIELDETFCKRCVKSFWAREATDED